MAKDHFVIQRHHLDLSRGEGRFEYHLDTKGEKFVFEDRIIFPPAKSHPHTAHAIKKTAETLAILFGVSYWKLFAPPTIELSGIVLTPLEAEFWNMVYTIGLGEFYYKNKFDFRGKRYFTADQSLKFPPPAPLSLQSRSLLLTGGGKDSIVSAEILKRAHRPFTSFMVNPTVIHTNVAEIVGAPTLTFIHTLDPLYFKVAAQPRALHGHIPVSLMYTFLGVLAAILYDYRCVIASNERSANYGNVAYLGTTINHQWSKSIETERETAKYIYTFIAPDLTYFSLLRPLSELEITARFSHYPRYFHYFSSCNKNFKIHKEQSSSLWCNNCPKCAFVFALLAAFLPEKTVMGIFGENLFAKGSLLRTYKELLGLEGVKPFECVGTPEETREAFSRARTLGDYESTPAMNAFKRASFVPAAAVQEFENCIPDEFKRLLLKAHETH